MVVLATACGDQDVVRPRNCGIDGPIDLLPVDGSARVRAVGVGERILAHVDDDDGYTTWSIDRCGADAIRLSTSHPNEGDTHYAVAAGIAVRCDVASQSVDWIDLTGDRPPHRIFDSAKQCLLWNVAGGLVAYDEVDGELEFHPHPSDPDVEATVLMTGIELSGSPFPGTLVSPWLELDRFFPNRAWPKVVGDRLVLNDPEGRFVELDPVTGETQIIYDRVAEDIRVLKDGERVLWHSWCTVDEPTSACSGTQIWDTASGTSTQKAPFMLISDVAEPWISLDASAFQNGKPAVQLRTYNLDDGTPHNFASELVAPPMREGDIVDFRPWELVGSPSPDVMLVAVPPEPFDWEEEPAMHLYWPATGALQAVELPYGHALETDAGYYTLTDGLRLLPTGSDQVIVLTEERSAQVVMPDGRAAQAVNGELRLFSPDGSAAVLDGGVTNLYGPPRPDRDLEDLFYVADGMFRRVPLP